MKENKKIGIIEYCLIFYNSIRNILYPLLMVATGIASSIIAGAWATGIEVENIDKVWIILAILIEMHMMHLLFDNTVQIAKRNVYIGIKN